MNVPPAGLLTLGHTHLRWDGTAAAEAGEHAVELGPASGRLAHWFEAGGLLGVQALNPLTEMAGDGLSDHALLATGPAAALPALCGVAFGFGLVAAVLEEDDRAVFHECAGAQARHGEALSLGAVAEAPAHHPYQRALAGCGGSVPDTAELAPLVDRLADDGQLILFGLPAAAMQTTFETLARRGLSLRGSGLRDGLGYLAGIIEHRNAFL